jgi:hypothetical protein
MAGKKWFLGWPCLRRGESKKFWRLFFDFWEARR